ncbi:MAG: histidine kinase, partial [Lachnospiraceae bacterium]|nr:histidine kinase [Lachnospiraceae bacterium]
MECERGMRKKLYRRILGTLLIMALVFVQIGSMGEILAEGNSEAAGHKITVDPTGRSEGFAAILYDNTNGLPTSEANDIIQTSEGFLWIGSYSGLIRYDGKNFERMDSTTGIASVVSLYADAQDRLWVGTNDSGVILLDKGTEKHYDTSNGLPSASVRSISEDSDGNILIATTHGIALVDKNLELSIVDESQIKEEYVRELCAGADGLIYGLTMNGAVFVLDKGRLTGFYEGAKLGLPSIHALYPDPKNPGYVYLGTKGNEVYYGKLEGGLQDAKVIEVSPLNYVNDIAMFQDQLWVCADNGIAIVEKGKCKKLEHIPLTHSIDKVTTDYQGNLWFTSSRQGVMKIVPDQFMNVFERYDLTDEVVNSTCYLDGYLYVGMDTGLLILSKDKVINRMPLNSAMTAKGQKILAPDLVALLSGSRIRSIIRDSKDRLWFSTYGKNSLIRYDHGDVVIFSMEDGLPSERIRTVVECKDGKILVACTGGVAVIEGDKISEVYNEDSGINNTEVLTVAEGFDGEIVIGTDGDGIYVIKDKNVTHIGKAEDGLQSGVVMRIKQDPQRKIFWIVVSNSLAYMSEDYKVTTIKKFPYPNNFDLIENSKGDIWVLSGKGIYVAQAEELIKNEEITTTFYSFDNGLSGVATSNSYSDVSAEGNLYIACSSGVVRVNIENT